MSEHGSMFFLTDTPYSQIIHCLTHTRVHTQLDTWERLQNAQAHMQLLHCMYTGNMNNLRIIIIIIKNN